MQKKCFCEYIPHQFEYRNKTCTLAGDCEPCPFKEMHFDYCTATRHRQAIVCSNSSDTVHKYKSCLAPVDEQGAGAFYLFEAILVGVLLGAGYLVMRRKQALTRMHEEKIARMVRSASVKRSMSPSNITPTTTVVIV